MIIIFISRITLAIAIIYDSPIIFDRKRSTNMVKINGGFILFLIAGFTIGDNNIRTILLFPQRRQPARPIPAENSAHYQLRSCYHASQRCTPGVSCSSTAIIGAAQYLLSGRPRQEHQLRQSSQQLA